MVEDEIGVIFKFFIDGSGFLFFGFGEGWCLFDDGYVFVIIVWIELLINKVVGFVREKVGIKDGFGGFEDSKDLGLVWEVIVGFYVY